MMLLSVLPPRLYIHCHQFTTQLLDLNAGFYSSALLFICNSCEENMRVCCGYVLVCMCKKAGGSKNTKRKIREEGGERERR